MSVGLIGRKLGMTQIFDDEGRALGVSVIQAGPCHVTQIKDDESDGYAAVQLGFDPVAERRLTQAERGHLGRLPAYRVLREFRIHSSSDLAVGVELTVADVDFGSIVDVAPFDDNNVRLALKFALPRKEIVETAIELPDGENFELHRPWID